MIKIFAAIGSLFAAAVWGFAFVVVKDSLNSVSASYMCAMRFTVGAAALALVFFRRISKITLEEAFKAALIGVFLFAAYFVQTIGCNYTSPGKNAFFTTVYVILIPLYGWLIYRKRPAWFVFVAVFLQLAGIGFLSLGDDVGEGIRLNLGDWLTILSSFFFALQMFYQSHFTRRSERSDPFVYAFVQFSVCAVLSWAVSPFYDAEKNSFTAVFQAFPVQAFQSGRFVVSLLYLALGSTALGFVLQNIGLKFLPQSFATILLSFESVFGMVFSVLVPVNGARESLTLWGIFGCILVFSAVLISQMEERPSAGKIRRISIEKGNEKE